MRSIRWKIILLTMLLVFAPLYAVNRYAVHAFNKFTTRSLENRMIDTAYAAGRAYRDGFDSGRRAGAEAMLGDVAEEAGMRLRIFDRAGTMVLDTCTDLGAEQPSTEFPEVQQALRGHYQGHWSVTPDRKYVYYYAAVPIMDGEQVDLIAHATCHTRPIIRAILRMFRDQRSALLMSLLLAALLSALLAETITRRIRRLTGAAAAYARGDSGVTFLQRGSDEIAQLASGFEHMTEELARRNTYNRDFVSTLLHELKAPVTAIKGAAELLEGGAAEKPEARQRFLTNISYQADRMDRLVNELAGLTRLDVELFEQARVRTEYTDLVRRLLGRLELLFDPPHAPLVTDLPRTPIHVRLVEHHIEQVFTNLLDNAYRYTPVHGRVTLMVRRQGDWVETILEDTGPGMAPGNVPRVFERFFTTERKDPSRSYGCGLGLAVVQRILQNHGGDIRAENRAKVGARFVFRLPVDE